MRRILIFVFFGLAILAIGAGVWWLTSRPSELFGSDSTSAQSPAGGGGTTPADLPLKPAREARPGYTEYRNEHYRFTFFYPDGLTVKEYDEGDGAMTVTFQNTATAQGFQIFIVPYGGQQVSEARFKQDESSGVRTGSRKVTIDGALGESFYSNSLSLGDTAEVWFINDGYLYEVTTLKPLAGWFSQIMGSWEFI